MRRALLLAACAAMLGLSPGEESPGGGGAARSPFPERSLLDGLGPAPALSALPVSRAVPVPEWKLAGPLPDRAGPLPRAAATAEEKLLEETASGRPGQATATEPMHCAAREIGRFVLDRGGMPESGLLEFIAARCGTTGSALRPAFLVSNAPEASPDAELLARWRPGIEELIRKSLVGAPVEVGLWFGRSADRAAAVVVSSPLSARVEPFSMVTEAGAVTIRGEVLEPTQAVSALVNRGASGFAGCEAAGGVGPPRFAFRCTLDPGDPEAMVVIALLPEGRLVTTSGLRTLARAPGAPGDTYRRIEAPTGPGPVEPPEIADAIHRAVNAVRRRVGVPPLVLSKTQSEEAARLAPHLFASSYGLAPPQVADLVVLGLAAGWRVGAPIHDVEMTVGTTLGSRDIGIWLDTVLRRPDGRAALLRPEAGILAVGGAALESPPFLAAVATSWAVFGRESRPEDARRVLDRIVSSRARDAKPPGDPPEPVAKAVRDAVIAIRDDGVAPLAALQRALEQGGKAIGRPLRGWVLQGPGLQTLPIPPDLVALEAPELAVGVGFVQPEGSPWAHYVVLVVAAEPDLSI